MGSNILHQITPVNLHLLLGGIISHHVRIQPLRDFPFNPVESASADKEDVLRVHRNHLLVRMFASSLRRHVHHGTFKQFQQSLLHPLTAHVARNRRIVAFTGNLVNLINEYDAALRFRHIIVSHLQQTCQDTLDILSHIARLGQHGRIDNSERHMKQFCDGTSQQSLSRSRASHHDYVRFLDLHIRLILRLQQTFVVVVHCHRQVTLGLILSDDILVQKILDVLRLREIVQIQFLRGLFLLAESFLHNLMGLFRAAVTDTSVDAGDKEAHLVFRTPAETASSFGS